MLTCMSLYTQADCIEVERVSASDTHVLAVDTSGRMFCWGLVETGALSNEFSQPYILAPVRFGRPP